MLRNGLEGFQVVLARLLLDVGAFVREEAACRMERLAVGREKPGHRVLRQPVDGEVGVQLAQFARDRQVAAGMAQTDRGRDMERALGAPWSPGPFPRCGRRRFKRAVEEVAHQGVEPRREPRVRRVSGLVEDHKLAPGKFGHLLGRGDGRDQILPTVHDQHRAGNAAVGRLVERILPSIGRTPFSRCLVECGSTKSCSEKNSAKSGKPVCQYPRLYFSHPRGQRAPRSAL
jgi:predicted transcriptional regulator